MGIASAPVSRGCPADEATPACCRRMSNADLFGDGSLKTIHTPGHTPGSMALLVNFRKSGPYILSGDQWHFTENHERRQVPTWNYDHDHTITSGKKLDDVISAMHATLVIQHEPADNVKLPKLPGFLD